MSKKPLIETNPYLKDAVRYRCDLITAASTSTAIETGARAGTIAKSLPPVPGPLPVKSPRRSAR